MAAGDFILSSLAKIREGDTSSQRPNSEAVNTKIGANINALIDTNYKDLNFTFNGYFSDSDLFKTAPIRIPNDSAILYYELGISDTGSSGNTTFNVAIYDSTGALTTNLFGSGANRVLISGSNGTDVLVGRDIAGGTTFDLNSVGHTIQYGTNNVVSITGGSYIVAFVESFATSARSLNFKLRLRDE